MVHDGRAISSTTNRTGTVLDGDVPDELMKSSVYISKEAIDVFERRTNLTINAKAYHTLTF